MFLSAFQILKLTLSVSICPIASYLKELPWNYVCHHHPHILYDLKENKAGVSFQSDNRILYRNSGKLK